ncbi:MAG: hypothetical protein ACLS29_08860 [Prevotellamassilia sp.]
MKRVDRFDEYMKTKGLNDNQVTKQIGLSIGTLGKSRKEGRDLSDKVIEKILNFYIDLNKVWLLTGEGEMLRSPITQESNGDHNTQVAGNHNHVEPPHGIEKALDEIAAQRKLVSKQEQ